MFQATISPLLFLAAMGLGLGGLVNKRSGGVDGVDYLVFVAPGLMAASAMMQARGRVAVAGARRGEVDAARTTRGRDAGQRRRRCSAGYVLWTCAPRAAVGVGVPRRRRVLGGVPSAWGVLAIPAAVLGAVGVRGAARPRSRSTQETDLPFPVIMRLGLLPLFLFSGTFFPISQLPDWLQPLSWFSPLWHAVELCRAATTGSSPSFGPSRCTSRSWSRALAAGCWWGVRRVHPGADRMISAIAVKEAGRRRVRLDGAWRTARRRAQRPRVPAHVAGVPHRLVRAVAVPAVDRHRRRRAGREGAGAGGQPIPYDRSSRRGCMAAAAMNGAVLDTTFNFFFKFKYAHTYDAMLATPLEVRGRRER